MVVSTFLVSDKDGRERFFEESFLLADVKPNIVLGMSFLTMSNADVDFQVQDLQLRSYTLGDILSIFKQVEQIRKKELVAVALDPKHEAFVDHVATLSVDMSDKMHPSRRVQIANVKVDEALTKVLSKYADFVDVFSPKLATKLPEHTEINDHAIKFVDD